MKKNDRIRKALAILNRAMALALVSSLVACADHTFSEQGTVDGDDVYLTLSLSTGAMDAAGSAKTRMSGAAEKDVDNVSVLVFRKEAGAADETATLYYVAEVTEVINSTNGFSTIAKLRRSLGNEEYSLVAIANMGYNVGMAYYGLTKAEVQAALTVDFATLWDASSSTARIPFWGESGFEVITPTTSFENDNRIHLLRAFARFDVGFNFDKAGGVSTDNETFLGLAGYTLKTVHVYRTRDKAAVMPELNNYDAASHKVTAPSVLGNLKNTGAQGSGDTGLTYAASPTLGASVRDIYLPENNADQPDQATVIVVGIEAADGHLGYYGMMLDTNADGNADPVLRNHRYVFSIAGITGRGQDDPDDALHTVTPDINYHIVEWDEQAEDAYISGNYYFKLSSRAVRLPVNKNDNVQLTYETNLPPSKVSWAWDATAPAYSDAVSYTVDTPVTTNGVTTGALTFHAPSNSTGVVIVNPLHFVAGDIQGAVTVTQNYIPMDYGLNCGSIKLYGGYMLNAYPNKTVNYIEMELTNIVNDMLGATWIVQTDAFNGLSFSGTGTFTKLGKQKIKLYPDESKLMTHGGTATLNITCNSTSQTLPTTCTVDVTIGFKTKRILSFSDGGGYGYGGNNPVSGSYHFLHSPSNFGIDTGTVPVSGLDFTYRAVGAMGVDDIAEIEKDPDIIIVGHASYWDYNSAAQRAILNYVNRGGVLVLLYEVYGENLNADPSTGGDQRITILFDNKVTYDDDGGGGGGSVNLVDCSQPNDPIATGIVGGQQYFSSIEGTYWGEDYGASCLMTIVPGYEDEFVTYTANTANANGGYTMLRYLKKNIVWVGDGGFLSCDTPEITRTRVVDGVTYTWNGVDSDGICPYALTTDGTYRPSMKPYSSNFRTLANNAGIFANIMAWAIYQAEYHGINSGGLSGV